MYILLNTPSRNSIHSTYFIYPYSPKMFLTWFHLIHTLNV